MLALAFIIAVILLARDLEKVLLGIQTQLEEKKAVEGQEEEQQDEEVRDVVRSGRGRGRAGNGGEKATAAVG